MYCIFSKHGLAMFVLVLVLVIFCWLACPLSRASAYCSVSDIVDFY